MKTTIPVRKLSNSDLIDNPLDASLYLAHHNSVLRPIIKKYGPCTLTWRTQRQSHFAALVETICFQQLAGSAARTIHSRVVGVAGGKINIESISRATDQQLRSAGLSQNKLLSIRSLTEHVQSKNLKLHRISSMEDEEVVDHLVQVRGIGRWSAHMFLIDRLHRLDIWPTGDYGVRVGISKLLNLKDVPTEKQCEPLGNDFQPFRSVLAWYCWKSVDETS